MILEFEDVSLNVQEEGDPKGRPLVFANSLGTDLHLWDGLLPHLAPGLRIIRWDKRGHGGSSVPAPPYGMGALVRDAERVCDALDVRDCIFVGLSIGGMIAQGLAVKRPDLIRALVLSNTAAKIATPEIWGARVRAVEAGGLESIADAVMERWFSPGFSGTPDWRARFITTPPLGYIGCCQAIAGTDLLTPTSGLRLPTLAIAGDRDGATPPDLVRETAALIPGARFEILRGTGHLPCVEDPAGYGALLTDFLRAQGHI